jgi:hypothetical protein
MSRRPPLRGFGAGLALTLGLFAAGPAPAAKCPNLGILLDRSGSMLYRIQDNTFASGTELSRWDIAQNAVTALLNQYDGLLPIGFAVFPTDSVCTTGSFVVDPAYNTKTNITSRLPGYKPPDINPDTPTCSAIESLRGANSYKDASRAQYILLVTDGDPYCRNTICGGGNLVDKTVAAITAAKNQTPSVHTFVVGFGGNLPTTLKANLDRMAQAGGEPNPDAAYDYYPADSQQALLTQLQRIITTITGGGDVGSTTLCDDSCYTLGCPNPGEVCAGATCKKNPCSGVTCPDGQYCYTDGSDTSATCIAPCLQSCGTGSRCVLGACQASPCAAACGANTRCDSATGECQTDPACSGVLCRGTRGCIGGACKDDPCTFIRCPAGLECVPFEGTCQPPGGPQGISPDGSLSTGCACDVTGTHSHHVAAAAPLLFLLATGLAGLRARRRRPA